MNPTSLHIAASAFKTCRSWPAGRTLRVVALSFQLAFSLAGRAHAVNNPEPVYHVALASMPTKAGADVLIPQVRGLYDGLEEAGYVEGKNLVIHKINEINETDARVALKGILGRRINAIVATSAMETALAMQITSTIPVIFAPARDPIRLGFIHSYARPGGNLTGLSYSRNFDDSAKQLAIFKQTVPIIKRATVLYSPRTTPNDTLDAVKRVASYLKIELAPTPVLSLIDAEQAVRVSSKTSTDGVFLVCSALFRELRRLTDIMQPKRLPLFGCTAHQVAEEGALMTYTPDIYFLGYRAAWYVDRILKGAKPHDLPVEVPDKFETVINLTTAKSLGLRIPPEKVILADKVFR